MKRHLISFLLVISFLLCMGMPAYAASEGTGFSDVAADAWYADAVEYVRDNGLMSGTDTSTFSPEQSMTRAMLAVVLYRIAGSPAVSGNSPFTDVDNNSWCADAVIWASHNNIVSGYGNGLFGTNHPITREQMATILWRYAGSPAADGSENFADQDIIASYAVPAVNWARANGIVGGKSGNIFDPNGYASRAQVATILMRYHTQNQNPDFEPTLQPEKETKMLVAYFSCTGTTESVAEQIAGITGGTLFGIVPEQPYTATDLAYNTNGRADREQNDPTARPAISNTVENMEDVDVVFLGYPMWHGQAPRIISTFLESYDFSGKTIIPFCTSHSSGIGSSDTNLHVLASEAEWVSGSRFAAGTTREIIENWIEKLNLPK